MIRRLLARLIPGRATRKLRVYGPDQHPVRRDRLSHAARTVIRKLPPRGPGRVIGVASETGLVALSTRGGDPGTVGALLSVALLRKGSAGAAGAH